jgi:hypothetical protein
MHHAAPLAIATALALQLASCRPPEPPASVAVTPPSLTPAPLAPAASCAAAWSACRRVSAPVELSVVEVGQMPDIVWDGRDVLVAYVRPVYRQTTMFTIFDCCP